MKKGLIKTIVREIDITDKRGYVGSFIHRNLLLIAILAYIPAIFDKCSHHSDKYVNSPLENTIKCLYIDTIKDHSEYQKEKIFNFDSQHTTNEYKSDSIPYHKFFKPKR